MLTIDALKAYGANTEEGLARCFNNESFYFRLVEMGLNDANFDRLRQAMEAGDAKAAFEAAHALKGSVGNLSLTPIYEPVSELTERLRGRSSIDGADDLMAQINDALRAARQLID